MKTIALSGTRRDTTGKRLTKQTRKEGRIPGVVYHNAEATSVEFDAKELRPVLYTAETFIVNLDIQGEKMDAIVRGADFHPVTEAPLHIEFLKVTDDKPVIFELPVEMVGTPAGVIKGGRLTIKMRKVKVKGIPAKSPEKVSVDVSHLDLGETAKLSAATVEGIEFITPPSAAVATVIIPRALRSAKEAAKNE
ncbi:50S ribosomal protein L25 [Pontibacter sp. G13]|uniref:50S ribosomal protein L25 n=1 Tax=Pontibacter sp. G13 TaxID=3074898 RepID=UPI0028896DDB|nr:50S ribosomal protein L25 [Pontibacter sp. G13]WNJ21226.1 50S ribosomal protein L25 [Pontibacter sp. G13]